MATPIYDTIEEQVKSETSGDLAYRNFHTNLTLTDWKTDWKCTIPYEHYIAEYRYVLQSIVKELNLDDLRYEYYRQNPQLLSNDLYGTTQFWAALLELNHCTNRYEFNTRKVLIYDPEKLYSMINDILIIEEELG